MPIYPESEEKDDAKPEIDPRINPFSEDNTVSKKRNFADKLVDGTLVTGAIAIAIKLLSEVVIPNLPPGILIPAVPIGYECIAFTLYGLVGLYKINLFIHKGKRK